MTKLAPFLYFFQDPATVFAVHLIYTHNIIHWYLLIILFFVYFTTASLLTKFTWNSFSKARGLARSLPSFYVFSWVQIPLIALIIKMAAYGLNYYVIQALFWTDALFELRDDPKSYLYYYYPEQLNTLKKIFIELAIPLEVLDEIALKDSTPDLYAVNKLTAEASYISGILCVLPVYIKAPNAITFSKYPDEKQLWLLHKHVDSYITPYFSRNYSTNSWFPHQAFLTAQKGNDSLAFEYSCVIIPTIIVFIILVHSLSLLYSGSEEINPGLHFTAVGHQWFWSYELEAIIQKLPIGKDDTSPPLDLEDLILLSVNFDSIPLAESSLSLGGKRLLEVDKPLVLPIGVPLKALVTSGDVLHSWSVPEMGIKIDAVPGRINDSISFIKRPGIFYGQCSELCGVGHGFMPIVVEALAVPNFIAWAQQLES